MKVDKAQRVQYTCNLLSSYGGSISIFYDCYAGQGQLINTHKCSTFIFPRHMFLQQYTIQHTSSLIFCYCAERNRKETSPYECVINIYYLPGGLLSAHEGHPKGCLLDAKVIQYHFVTDREMT